MGKLRLRLHTSAPVTSLDRHTGYEQLTEVDVTNEFKVDIHYITSYITYKRYNLNKNRKHINTYIYIYIYVYLQKHSNKFSKPFNNRHLEFPTKSLALIQYSLFALLDKLSRNDLILRSKTCCQWISLPPECLRHKGVHAMKILEFMNSRPEVATADATDALVGRFECQSRTKDTTECHL